ncbi:MAG: 3-oxoacyl-[acyl-carrier-protein] synthase II [Myxococcota bacterium]|jgi:3-oxoacyl-[acyl-carrier-protein] synthase II
MRRVVVTGLGAVSPCGLTHNSNWAAITAGQSGTGLITRFDTEGWRVRIAAEVKGFDPETCISRREVRRMDLFTQYGMVAAHEAICDAGLDPDARLGEQAGVYVGSGIGGINEIEQGAIAVHERGPRAVSAFFIPKSLSNLTGGNIAIRYGAMGPSLCISTACAVGNHSIGEAWRTIAMGGADLIIAGGAEAPITPLSIAGFSVMRALSRNHDEPEAASRPFDADRDGFVMGEGAGILIMEDLETAQARGARIYAEIIGYHNTTDAHHITAPPPGHAGAARCMTGALRSAGLGPESVDYINAHGTSTPQNDVHEATAIHTVFGEHASRIAVSSTKSMTGHLLGAAGGLEAVLSVLALHHGIVPPNATLRTKDPDIDLNLPTSAYKADIQVALSNAFGFGGANATLIFRRWNG